MAYMRDPFYVYSDGEQIHIHDPSGGSTTIPLATFDELCAMRWAQLGETEQAEAEYAAIEKYTGDFGCDALRKKCGLEAMSEVAIRKAELSAKSAKAVEAYFADVRAHAESRLRAKDGQRVLNDQPSEEEEIE